MIARNLIIKTGEFDVKYSDWGQAGLRVAVYFAFEHLATGLDVFMQSGVDWVLHGFLVLFLLAWIEDPVDFFYSVEFVGLGSLAAFFGCFDFGLEDFD